MEWKTLAGASGYIETKGALLGTYRLAPDKIVLFDSGVEADEELLTLLDRFGVTVRAIVCTHLHLDHMGNNQLLVDHHGAEVYAHAEAVKEVKSRTDVPFSIDYPFREVDHTQPLTIDGVSFAVIPTFGHSEGHLAYATPDGVCCVGDAILGPEKLRQSKLPYMEDVDLAIVGMEALRATEYDYYIVAHRSVIPRAEIGGLIEENIEKELLLYDILRRSLTQPMTMEEAIDRYLDGIGVQSQTMREKEYVRWTARIRICALAKAGEFTVEDEWVIPKINDHRPSTCL